MNFDVRRAARLAAVQALYQMELAGEDAQTVAQEFVEHRLGREPEVSGADGEADAEFFTSIVHGVPHHQVEIDRAIANVLAADWRLERVDSILRAILRAASFELIARRDVPAKAVIDEYVEVSHAFFSGDEPSFVNAALDKMARRKRAAEFGLVPPDDELQF
ncbi:MAG: transcription antitermination factor NusB [Rhizomicrobium sp.]